MNHHNRRHFLRSKPGGWQSRSADRLRDRAALGAARGTYAALGILSLAAVPPRPVASDSPFAALLDGLRSLGYVEGEKTAC